MGVARPKRFFGVGNAGEPEWVWEVMDLSEDDPRYGWFIQVTHVRQHPPLARRPGSAGGSLGHRSRNAARWNSWAGVPWAWATRSIPSC